MSLNSYWDYIQFYLEMSRKDVSSVRFKLTLSHITIRGWFFLPAVLCYADSLFPHYIRIFRGSPKTHSSWGQKLPFFAHNFACLCLTQFLAHGIHLAHMSWMNIARDIPQSCPFYLLKSNRYLHHSFDLRDYF